MKKTIIFRFFYIKMTKNKDKNINISHPKIDTSQKDFSTQNGGQAQTYS